jgi:hypothetical protein
MFEDETGKRLGRISLTGLEPVDRYTEHGRDLA